MPKRKVGDADVERGRRIRVAYEAIGYTRKRFAEALGRYYHDVGRLEAGQKPDPETLCRIAELCGVTERWLVRGPNYADGFKAWLANGAPDDLRDAERELLASINFPEGHHPGSDWYSIALTSWRSATRRSLLEQTQVRTLKSV